MLTQTKKKEFKLNKNVVCLQKGFVNLVTKGAGNIAFSSTVQSKLMQYGYMLDAEAFKALSAASVTEILEFHDEVIDFLNDAMGGKYAFTPLYRDFPTEIMSEEDITLMQNVLGFYYKNHELSDIHPLSDKSVAFEKVKYTMISPGDDKKLAKVFTDLVSVNTSLLPQDLEIVKWFVKSGYPLVFPEAIPFKENLCTLAGMGIAGLPIKTPTDVLRIAVHMSGGDISLPAVPKPFVKVAKSPYKRGMTTEDNSAEREKFKFRNFKRSERKYILGLLEQTHCDPKEMVLKAQRWIRLAEVLHPGEYSKQFPKSHAAFHAIRNTKVQSWYGKLKETFDKSFSVGLQLLVSRPGEFIRRVDWLVRTYSKELAPICIALQVAVKGASNKVLFELYTHFEKRDKDLTNRSIMIKGKRKRTKLPDLGALPKDVIDKVQSSIMEALGHKFSKLDPLDKCFIDPELKKIPIPTNMRSVNFTLKPTVRGTRIPINNTSAKVIRPFFHWIDRHGSLDPDLSATFVGMGKSQVLSYRNLNVGKSVHSGDIIARQGACAEYIDIDIADAKKMGFKYVVIDVRNYRGGSMHEMQGVFGLMERKYPESNNTWLPETGTGCQAMESTASVTLASIIDLDTMEYIFLDIDTTGTTYASGDTNSILDIIKQYSEPPKFSVYDLVMLHVQNRGISVPEEEATEKFTFDQFCNDYIKTSLLMGV